MPPYTNLVSDSTLVQDTIDLLNTSGGRAAASEIVDHVFKLSHIDDELAGLLVADLIRNDRRFKIIENNTVELLQDDSHLRLLKDLDFVVVDDVVRLENAIFAALPAGAYTAVVSGADGGTGVTLAEVYQLP